MTRPGILVSAPRLLALLLGAGLLLGAAGLGAKADPRAESLPEKYRQWLAEVELLITDEERDSFLGLEKDYQRDAFIDTFWEQRDPYPATAKNEFRDRWQARIDEARMQFGGLDTERARMLLLNGAPAARIEVDCHQLWPIEVWYYAGTERLREEIALVFYQRWSQGPYRLWQPFEGVEALYRHAIAAPGQGRRPLDRIRNCGRNSSALLAAIANASKHGRLGYPMLVMELTEPPEEPGGEWLATFDSYSTELPDDAETFEADLDIGYPGRHQSRTVVQATLTASIDGIATAEFGGAHSVNLLLTGEVVADDELFDRFRYKFDIPEERLSGDAVPLVFERRLRPGDYRLVLKVEDLNSDRFFRTEREISVPRLERAVAAAPSDPETAAILEEANRALSAFDASVEIIDPIGGMGMQTGKVRFDALVTGENVDRVAFALDAEPVLVKQAPPWSVELDLGKLPHSQTLRVTALADDGTELADDEILVNASSHRFNVRLARPLPETRARSSLRAVAEVESPEDRRVDRVELYVGEELQATLYQPPYEQILTLPEPGALTYVRAVAYLPDGASTDDHVFVNAPEGLEEIDVQLVELYVGVYDRSGRPVEGLERADFDVVEDGEAQTIRRFERVEDLSFHALVLLDTSASMEERLEDAQAAALGFFEEALEPEDRAGLVTFNDRPLLKQKFTGELRELGGALAGLKAERGTALWDSVVYSLFYFNGVGGQRALVVLSDGEDESSRFNFDETLEFARRAGVTIYTIGLDLDVRKARRQLGELAEKTGGRSFFVTDSSELGSVYAQIEEELRSQYLLTYQSTNSAPDDEFRRVEVTVDESGLTAKTVEGYYP